MRITFLVLLFLFTGAFFIISNENLDLNLPNERMVFFEGYYNWVLSLVHGSVDNVKQVTSFVIKSEWLPEVPPAE